jgi:3'5'-cyclic nucleotide phosphodiesterase
LPKADIELHEKFGGKACQEQNSVAVGWEVLMRPEFSEIREAIYHTKDELTRFRQIIVRQVIATEIFDPSLAEARLARWEEAFKEESKSVEARSRKAAAVMEMLIQVADVSHIMQSYNRYIKWNLNLFTEMWAAHKKGYLEKNPSENWFEGELRFLDTYAIPLATRMAESGVFSSKYLENVQKNREKWDENGKALVNSMTIKMKAEDESFADAVDLV